MGMHKRPSGYRPGGPSGYYGGSGSTAAKKLPNPNPANYVIKKSEEVGAFLILLIHYPDCTNYEGNKILVFKGVKPLDLLNQKLIDPHFFVDPKVASPIARFVPTDEGWEMAIRFAKAESQA